MVYEKEECKKSTITPPVGIIMHHRRLKQTNMNISSPLLLEVVGFFQYSSSIYDMTCARGKKPHAHLFAPEKKHLAIYFLTPQNILY